MNALQTGEARSSILCRWSNPFSPPAVDRRTTAPCQPSKLRCRQPDHSSEATTTSRTDSILNVHVHTCANIQKRVAIDIFDPENLGLSCRQEVKSTRPWSLHAIGTAGGGGVLKRAYLHEELPHLPCRCIPCLYHAVVHCRSYQCGDRRDRRCGRLEVGSGGGSEEWSVHCGLRLHLLLDKRRKT